MPAAAGSTSTGRAEEKSHGTGKRLPAFTQLICITETQRPQSESGVTAQKAETSVIAQSKQRIKPKTSSEQRPRRSTSTLQTVRPQVRALLGRSPGYHELPPDKRKQLAASMARVAAYVADPAGLIAQEFRKPLLACVVSRGPMRRLQSTNKLRPPGLRGDTNQFDALVGAVDFPGFVASLISGVFGAIVNASIEQMKAYQRLIESVAKTVDQFKQDNISDAGARDALVREFASVLCWEGTQGAASGRRGRLVLCADAKRTCLARIGATIGLKQRTADLSSDQGELRLVTATRRRIARNRQQLLATMLLMGINRIIVTDGSINARGR